MGGGLVCSPTLPLFSPFAGIPIFPPVPLSPSPTPIYSPHLSNPSTPSHPRTERREQWGQGLTTRTRFAIWDHPKIRGHGNNASKMRSNDLREEKPVLRGSVLGPLWEMREK